MWIQLPPNYIGNDLPFFTDSIGSTYGKGYVFAPSFGQTEGSVTGWPGAWAFSIYDAPENAGGNGAGVYGAVGSINGPGPISGTYWHNLIYVMDRKAGATVYLDGTNAQQYLDGGTSITAAGDIDTTNAATIGQDPTGLYPQPGTSSIDDLGVWRRALTPLEAASIYMAAVSNKPSLSFVGTPTLSLQMQPGPKLQLTWSAGNLQATTNLSGTWTNVVGATSPYTNSPTGAQQFFRVQE
jgi:hypothetical protein